MMITYSCDNCQTWFDGHWDKVEERRKQFPAFTEFSDWAIVKVCPDCGHYNQNARNMDCDEDFSPEIENDYNEEDEDED